MRIWIDLAHGLVLLHSREGTLPGAAFLLAPHQHQPQTVLEGAILGDGCILRATQGAAHNTAALATLPKTRRAKGMPTARDLLCINLRTVLADVASQRHCSAGNHVASCLWDICKSITGSGKRHLKRIRRGSGGPCGLLPMALAFALAVMRVFKLLQLAMLDYVAH